MRIPLLVFLISLAAYSSPAQIRTEETRTEIDTVKGDTTVTKAVIISQSEDITPRSSMLVVNPLKFFLFYNLSYYHRLSPSAVVGGGFQIPTLSDVNGFGINIELRLHPSGKALKGFYFAPNASYSHLESGGDKTSPFSLGVLIGWQWFPGDEFAMGLGIGVDYYVGTLEENGDLEEYHGAVPALRFDIGYAW
jgi:hypothetical protein